jgi:predicted amidohydrolase YtcJ
LVIWTMSVLTRITRIAAVVGPEHTSRYFAMRKVEDAGGRIVLASDQSLYMQTPARLDRDCRHQEAAGRLTPRAHRSPKRSSLEGAIAARTIKSAYLTHSEDKLGSIEVGKLADFIVLDKDLFSIPIEKVNEAQVLTTVVEGEVVFQAME